VLRLGELKYQEGSESLLNLFTVRDSAEQADPTSSPTAARVLNSGSCCTQRWRHPTKAQPLPTAANTANGKP